MPSSQTIQNLECPMCHRMTMTRLEQAQIWGGDECFVAVDCPCGFHRILRDDFAPPLTDSV